MTNGIEVLGKAEPPFVHCCKEVNRSSVSPSLKAHLPDFLLVEIDGSDIPDEEALVNFCNDVLGLRLADSPPRSTELHWMRLNDLIKTDVNFQNRSGCVILLRNAEECLSSAKDGLVRLGSALASAGTAYAYPEDLGLDEKYAQQPIPFHTIFLFGRVTPRAPNAEPIELPI